MRLLVLIPLIYIYAQNLICSIWYKQHRLFVGQYFHSPIAIPRVFVDVFWQLPRESRTVSSARHTPVATFLIIYILGWLYALVWLSLGCFAAAKMSSYIYIYRDAVAACVGWSENPRTVRGLNHRSDRDSAINPTIWINNYYYGWYNHLQNRYSVMGTFRYTFSWANTFTEITEVRSIDFIARDVSLNCITPEFCLVTCQVYGYGIKVADGEL